MIKYIVDKENKTVMACIYDRTTEVRNNIFKKFKKSFKRITSDNSDNFPAKALANTFYSIKNECKNVELDIDILLIFKNLIESVVCEDKMFIGTAKCLPEDEFDEEIGKKIARQKAILKSKKYYGKKREILIDIVSKFMIIPIINLKHNDQSFSITDNEKEFCNKNNIDYKKIMGR